MVKITTKAKTADLRDELYRISQRPEWAKDRLWDDFLKGRKILFDEIHNSLGNPSVVSAKVIVKIQEQFVERAKEYWSSEEDNWMLAGGWLERQDIMDWMWRRVKQRLVDRAAALPVASAGDAESSTSAQGEKTPEQRKND